MYDFLDHDANILPFLALTFMYGGCNNLNNMGTIENHQGIFGTHSPSTVFKEECSINNFANTCCCNRDAINKDMDSKVSQVSEIRDLQLRFEAQRMQAEIQSLNASVINQLRTQNAYRPTDKIECEMDISDEESNDATSYYSDNMPEESIVRTLIDVDRDDEGNPYYEEKNTDYFEKDAKYESDKRMLDEKMAEVKRAHSVGMITTNEALRMISAIKCYGYELDEQHELKEKYIRLGKYYVDTISKGGAYKEYMECKARTRYIIESRLEEKDDDCDSKPNDIYHDKSSLVRIIRKIVNKLNDIIGAILDVGDFI